MERDGRNRGRVMREKMSDKRKRIYIKQKEKQVLSYYCKFYIKQRES